MTTTMNFTTLPSIFQAYLREEKTLLEYKKRKKRKEKMKNNLI